MSLNKIFLSYAKEDKAAVEKVYIELRRHSFSPWMDSPPIPFRTEGLQPGENWDVAIRREMKRANLILAFLSSTSIAKTGYVQRELRVALELLESMPQDRIFLVPVLLDSCRPPTLKVGTVSLSDLQYYDLRAEGLSPLLVFLSKQLPTPSKGEATLSRGEIADLGLVSGPVILWSNSVGAQKWKNTPQIYDGVVYVGSAGRVWNQPDSADGVYAFDTSTGDPMWFTQTLSDANALLVTGEHIICGTDRGMIWCLDRATGTKRWAVQLESAILHAPVRVGEKCIFVTAVNGDSRIIDIENGEEKASRLLLGSFLSDLASDSTTGHVLVPSKENGLYVLSVDSAKIDVVRRIEINVEESQRPHKRAGLYCPPIKFEDRWLLPFVRDTYYDKPAIVSLDLSQKKAETWRASDPSQVLKSWGNIRSTPILFQDTLLFSAAYSRSLVSVSAKDGHALWEVSVGDEMFPQWPQPVLSGTIAIIPRHDGTVYGVDANSQRLLWSVFLGKRQFAGLHRSVIPIPENVRINKGWDPLVGSPLYASPAIDEAGRLFIGTDDGFLYCLGNSK